MFVPVSATVTATSGSDDVSAIMSPPIEHDEVISIVEVIFFYVM